MLARGHLSIFLHELRCWGYLRSGTWARLQSTRFHREDRSAGGNYGRISSTAGINSCLVLDVGPSNRRTIGCCPEKQAGSSGSVRVEIENFVGYRDDAFVVLVF